MKTKLVVEIRLTSKAYSTDLDVPILVADQGADNQLLSLANCLVPDHFLVRIAKKHTVFRRDFDGKLYLRKTALVIGPN